MSDTAKIIRLPALCDEPHGAVDMLLIPGAWLTAVEAVLRRDEAKYHWLRPDLTLHEAAQHFLRQTLRDALIAEGIMKGKAQS